MLFLYELIGGDMKISFSDSIIQNEAPLVQKLVDSSCTYKDTQNLNASYEQNKIFGIGWSDLEGQKQAGPARGISELSGCMGPPSRKKQ